MRSATIQIKRGNDYFGVARKLKVYIDEQHVGGVRWQQTEDFVVTPGRHLVYVKMDWCTSKPTWAVLDADEIVTFQVFLTGNEYELAIFRQMYDMIFYPNEFFKLKEIE